VKRIALRMIIVALIATLCNLSVSQPFAQTPDTHLDLYMLGVYEGHNHKYGKVTVFVAPQDHPIALLLTAFESVDWQIELEPGARLAKVFLNGYHEQHVSGLPSDVPVQSHSYDQRSPNYMYGHDNGSCFTILDKARQLYGASPRQYLCQYRGIAFVGDRDGIRPLPVY
jgi:hypothetical protein